MKTIVELKNLGKEIKIEDFNSLSKNISKLEEKANPTKFISDCAQRIGDGEITKRKIIAGLKNNTEYEVNFYFEKSYSDKTKKEFFVGKLRYNSELNRIPL
jgi:hypothetical protein